MRVEPVMEESRLLGSVYGRMYWEYRVSHYIATHGRVTATAPTMHEAIALCLNGVYQLTYIK